MFCCQETTANNYSRICKSNLSSSAYNWMYKKAFIWHFQRVSGHPLHPFRLLSFYANTAVMNEWDAVGDPTHVWSVELYTLGYFYFLWIQCAADLFRHYLTFLCIHVYVYYVYSVYSLHSTTLKQLLFYILRVWTNISYLFIIFIKQNNCLFKSTRYRSAMFYTNY